MKFKTPYDVSEGIYTTPGEFTRPTFKAVLRKDGDYDLVADGIELTYEKIQSFKDSVDVNLIVQRYAAGDVYALEQSTGSYGDFIQIPGSYRDVLNSIIDARNAYEMSDMDVSFEEFVSKALEPLSEHSEHIEREVVEDEQKSE